MLHACRGRGVFNGKPLPFTMLPLLLRLNLCYCIRPWSAASWSKLRQSSSRRWMQRPRTGRGRAWCVLFCLSMTHTGACPGHSTPLPWLDKMLTRLLLCTIDLRLVSHCFFPCLPPLSAVTCCLQSSTTLQSQPGPPRAPSAAHKVSCSLGPWPHHPCISLAACGPCPYCLARLPPARPNSCCALASA